MGPGDIKQKIDERGAKSNLPSALSGEGFGGPEAEWSPQVGALRAPRQMLPPEFGLLDRGLGRNRHPSPEPHPPQPFGLCSISGGISAPLRTPCPAEPDRAPQSHPLRGHGTRIGTPTYPLPPLGSPTLGGPSSAQSSPAPTAWSRRRDRTGRHELPSPHPRASANREQVTTRAASGVAALRRFAGRERPLFSARGAAPPGRARRLLAPTPSRRALKGATRPTGLYPCRGEGHAGGWQRSKRSAFPPPLGQNSVAASPCPGLWSGGGPGPAATRHSLPETSRLEQDTLS
ncbi:ESX-1 secretion-associated protein EspI-like [Rhinolophus ferrumequinum]|uniref:ESX-1 secretion-associated protein EspI-like n=1 Tax=Rhinolophus ferrumequinum TaxID=59479 RepID=UPI00140FF6FE|nr:ESX-1 secretion-associated protein EspI-like [Rhinolophus ferrumequinum]